MLRQSQECAISFTWSLMAEFLFTLFCLLQNIVAVGAGFVEGLKYGDNTKAAVIRLGLMEMVKFIEEFYQSNSYY